MVFCDHGGSVLAMRSVPLLHAFGSLVPIADDDDPRTTVSPEQLGQLVPFMEKVELANLQWMPDCHHLVLRAELKLEGSSSFLLQDRIDPDSLRAVQFRVEFGIPWRDGSAEWKAPLFGPDTRPIFFCRPLLWHRRRPALLLVPRQALDRELASEARQSSLAPHALRVTVMKTAFRSRTLVFGS